MRMSCCDVKYADKLCRACLDIIATDFNGIKIGRCPLCESFFTMSDGIPYNTNVKAICNRCRGTDKKEIADLKGGLCAPCLLGDKFTFRYECSRCHKTQPISYPLWTAQPSAEEFTREGWWACHQDCHDYCGWRIVREDALKIPLAFCFANWGLREVWLEEIRRERGKKTKTNKG